jgi:DNA-binding SARP family transcriptional activator
MSAASRHGCRVLRERGLLALLLLSAGRTVAASSLIDRLWSETASPADPSNALQLRVSKLRRALTSHGLDVIRRDASGYRADVDPARVDLHRFAAFVQAARAAAGGRGGGEALVLYDKALALWTGEPLADFAGQGWATVEAARLDQLHRAALNERAEEALGAGRHAEVAGDLEPIVARDPGQEALAGLLMTALYRAGRQADALEAYARTRRYLDDELGLQPSAALRALHEQILQQDEALQVLSSGPSRSPQPELAPPTQRSASTPAVGQDADLSPKRTVPVPSLRLIGRDEQLSDLRQAVVRQRMGHAGRSRRCREDVPRCDGCPPACRRLRSARPPGPPGVGDRSGRRPARSRGRSGVPLDGAEPNPAVRARLLAYLANRRLLLVLDNCEHVVDAAAKLVGAILDATEHVTVLATSREALAVPGEVQVSVAPLAVPPVGTDVDAVLKFPAAALFAERAHAVRASWHSSEADLLALAHICRRLDGMPLALELAAARVSSLSLPDLADRLDDRFACSPAGPALPRRGSGHCGRLSSGASSCSRRPSRRSSSAGGVPRRLDARGGRGSRR